MASGASAMRSKCVSRCSAFISAAFLMTDTSSILDELDIVPVFSVFFYPPNSHFRFGSSCIIFLIESTMLRAVCLSSLRSRVRAVSVYSIVQGKGFTPFGGSRHFLCPLTKPAAQRAGARPDQPRSGSDIRVAGGLGVAATCPQVDDAPCARLRPTGCPFSKSHCL